MLLSPKNINELIYLIDNLHWIFINDELGSEFVPEIMFDVLKKFGISKRNVTSLPAYAYHYGILSMVLGDSKVEKYDFDNLKKYLTSGKWLPLTQWEKDSLALIEDRLTSGIKGLGNKVSSDLKTILIEGNLKQRKDYEKTIKEKAKKVFSERGSVKQLVSELGHSTGDWARDFGRIAQYVLHEAYDNGRASALLRQHNGKANEVKVYKMVHDGACKTCKGLYETKDRKTKEIVPRIYTLEQLIKNGTNIGRKAGEAKAVIGATHPWCRCDLHYVPANSVWDSKLKIFKEERSESAKKYNLSKFIKVNIKQ